MVTLMNSCGGHRVRLLSCIWLSPGYIWFALLKMISHLLTEEISVLCQLSDLFFIQYNGISMKNKTKEDAYLEMLKPAETITFKVRNCVDSLADIKESPGDGFFIR